MSGYLRRVVDGVVTPPKLRPIPAGRFTASSRSPFESAAGDAAGEHPISLDERTAAPGEHAATVRTGDLVGAPEARAAERARSQAQRRPPAQSDDSDAPDSRALPYPAIPAEKRVGEARPSSLANPLPAAHPGADLAPANAGPQHARDGPRTPSPDARETAEPAVHIHIGRIDVRAVASPVPATVARPVRSSPLDEHLRARDGARP